MQKERLSWLVKAADAQWVVRPETDPEITWIAAKPDQIVCKTTMPTMVASRIRASQIETDSAARRLGGEIESSLFFRNFF